MLIGGSCNAAGAGYFQPYNDDYSGSGMSKAENSIYASSGRVKRDRTCRRCFIDISDESGTQTPCLRYFALNSPLCQTSKMIWMLTSLARTSLSALMHRQASRNE